MYFQGLPYRYFPECVRDFNGMAACAHEGGSRWLVPIRKPSKGRSCHVKVRKSDSYRQRMKLC